MPTEHAKKPSKPSGQPSKPSQKKTPKNDRHTEDVLREVGEKHDRRSVYRASELHVLVLLLGVRGVRKVLPQFEERAMKEVGHELCIQATHERCAKLCEPRPAPTVDSGLPRGERLRGARWGPGVAGALLAVRRQHLRSGRSARSQAVETLFQSGKAATRSAQADPLCWLEELETPAVRSWVEAQNARSLSQLGDPRHSPLWPRLCETETTDTEADPLRKLPQATEIGGYFYDFWSDASHVVLDLDELCRAEGESYVWRGFDVEAVQEPPERAMLLLSRGGQDAFVAREFDLTRRAFLSSSGTSDGTKSTQGGFVVPEGKSVVSFCSRDVLLVSGDFGPGTLTNAGYPRCVRVWRRGTRLTSSPLLFEGDAHDHVVFGYVPSKALQVVQRSLNFHAAELSSEPIAALRRFVDGFPILKASSS
eukprot:g17067.t1